MVHTIPVPLGQKANYVNTWVVLLKHVTGCPLRGSTRLVVIEFTDNEAVAIPLVLAAKKGEKVKGHIKYWVHTNERGTLANNWYLQSFIFNIEVEVLKTGSW